MRSPHSYIPIHGQSLLISCGAAEGVTEEHIFGVLLLTIDPEWPILAVLQLFQYFPTKGVQIDSEWTILAFLPFSQYFPTKVVQIYLEWPILAILQLFQYFPTEVF